MRSTWKLIVAVSAAFASGAAPAEDGAAVTAGGLVLARNDGIDLVSQDLHVSRQAIRIRYVFRNRGAQDVTRTLAFPVPDRTPERGASELAFPGGFETRVDGRPVEIGTGPQALAGGTDHSALLARLNIPVRYLDAAFEPVSQALAALPRDEQARLAALGLVEIFDEDGGARRVWPRWTIREVWQWEQVLPAGRDLVVEHGYSPGFTGAIDVGMSSEAMRNSESGQEMIRTYCLDDTALAAFDRLALPRGEDYPGVGEYRLTYDLAAGGGWPSGVGEFRLVVDKGAADNVVGFCGQDVRQIGPTQYEMRRTGWRPDGPLRFVFFEPESTQ